MDKFHAFLSNARFPVLAYKRKQSVAIDSYSEEIKKLVYENFSIYFDEYQAEMLLCHQCGTITKAMKHILDGRCPKCKM